MKGLAVVMPAFNEAPHIRGLAEAVLAQAVGRLIVVDDGSTDGTGAALAGLDLMLLTHPANRGKGAALITGLRAALATGVQAVVTIDADGQHRPEDLPRLIAAAADQPHALVIAARLRGRERAPGWRRFGNRVADFWVSWACARPVTDSQSGLRLYPAAELAALGLGPGFEPGTERGTERGINRGFAFETALLIDLLQTGTELCTLPIDTLYDPAGRLSHYQPWRDTARIVRLVAGRLARRGFSPLALARGLGWLTPPRGRAKSKNI